MNLTWVHVGHANRICLIHEGRHTHAWDLSQWSLPPLVTPIMQGRITIGPPCLAIDLSTGAVFQQELTLTHPNKPTTKEKP